MIFDFLRGTNWKKRGNAWTGQAIADQFEHLPTPPAFLWRRDRDFQALPRKDFKKFSWRHWTPTDYPQYQPEIFDCDDFAACYHAALIRAWAKTGARRALACGCCGGLIDHKGERRLHAFNWAMDNDGKIYFIEPQTGEPMTAQVYEITYAEI